ncbi:MAG: glutamine-hydrolyzing carbamoyl-phosphate synthase small subunit [Deltaproteobacteria bacterium]|nr:glutamine-hydrolyzing carbamoyl-phosphate synthase small subunit [Deltaproteobacteria bacterium]
MKRGLIVLEDGTVYQGESFGFSGEKIGEIVFNTGMSGYQEVLTDPSYKGQLVVMTYPLIGNYGINTKDQESGGPQVSGFIVKENSELPSNWRSENSLSSYLMQHRIIGIEGVDTRAITRHIRLQGAMKAIISTEIDDIPSLLAKVKTAPGLVGRDLVKEVTCREAYIYRDEPAEKNELSWLEYLPDCSHQNAEKEAGQKELQIPKRYFVVAMDFGIKQNILRQLEAVGCEVKVVPAHCPAEEILSLKPHGVFLSNGPGDPAAVKYAIETVKNLIGRVPIFGICLGHQILGLALGGKTYKLKFGHRGCNHPVKNLSTGRVEITSQNHGFCVDIDSLPSHDITITHLNLNDQTVEGMRHNSLPLFSVQYHPEASPGPHDSHYLFRRFYEMVEKICES